jgi:hypothetical protein
VSSQHTPQITALSDGGWVITWISHDEPEFLSGFEEGPPDIYAQAYNADGSVQGGETQINTYTTGNQNSQQITALSDGNATSPHSTEIVFWAAAAMFEPPTTSFGKASKNSRR